MATNKKKKKNSSNIQTFTGKLQIVKSGMGFVAVPGLEQDIMIKRGDLGTALDGDEVKVEIRGYEKKGRKEGEIIKVVRRSQTDFSGRIEVKPNFAFFIADKASMPVDVFVPLHLLNGAKDGDHAIVRITEWPEKAKNPVGEVISLLTNESTNEIAMQGLLIDNGFPLHFPDEVLEEAARFSEFIDKDELKKRKDIRGILTFTIDPADAKDFDDAISFQILKNGDYEIGVHIADVSHFMQAGTELDKEAYRRATSVYLPDRVLPMLPEHLSNGLCSLRPHEDKYTFSAIFSISPAGKIKSHWLGRTVMHSDRRFAYEQVQDIIEGKEDDLQEQILTLNKLAQGLRKERFKKGAINFSSQEVRFTLDTTGKPIGIVVKESKEAHQLIEEFMLLANRTVAEYVSGIKVKDKPVPFPYRVHDVPDSDKLKLFTTFASRFGHTFNLGSPETIAKSFNEMLQLVKGKPEQHVLESLGIRTMSKAVYTTENIGHYGLGFENYCHFTSPIRRYPDVLAHRILQECLDGDVHPIKQLEQQCRHCSEQERNAMDAERAGNKYKQVEFMQQYVGEDFDAIVSGVASFGFWAETVAHKCEGMISRTDLTDIDEFELLEHEYALVGRYTGIRFRIGDKVRVKIVAANLEKRQIDMSLLEMPQQSSEIKQKRHINAQRDIKKQRGRPSGSSKRRR